MTTSLKTSFIIGSETGFETGSETTVVALALPSISGNIAATTEVAAVLAAAALI